MDKSKLESLFTEKELESLVKKRENKNLITKLLFEHDQMVKEESLKYQNIEYQLTLRLNGIRDRCIHEWSTYQETYDWMDGDIDKSTSYTKTVCQVCGKGE